jgi:hypothetical protein
LIPHAHRLKRVTLFLRGSAISDGLQRFHPCAARQDQANGYRFVLTATAELEQKSYLQFEVSGLIPSVTSVQAIERASMTDV